MSGHRAERVASQLRQELMEMITRELKDPRLGFISITRVKVSPDLANVRVAISVLGDQAQQQASLEGLRSAMPYLRRNLGRRLENLRRAPNVSFEMDASIAHGVHINQLLRDLLGSGPNS